MRYAIHIQVQYIFHLFWLPSLKYFLLVSMFPFKKHQTSPILYARLKVGQKFCSTSSVTTCMDNVYSRQQRGIVLAYCQSGLKIQDLQQQILLRLVIFTRLVQSSLHQGEQGWDNSELGHCSKFFYHIHSLHFRVVTSHNNNQIPKYFSIW